MLSFIVAFVEPVDDDQSRNARFPERPHDQFVHLVLYGIKCEFWMPRHQLGESRTNLGVAVRESVRKSGEDEPRVAPVLRASRAEGGAEPPVRKRPLCDRLGDGGLPLSGCPGGTFRS